MKEIMINVMDTSQTLLEEYGLIVARKPKQKPDNQGEGWQCWYPLGVLPEATGSLQIGLVRTTLNEPLVKLVECHPVRGEWVYAIDRPIIQVVALSSASIPQKLANVATAKAVLLNPGEGILIRAGVWHAPAFAADLAEAVYGFVLEEVDPKVRELGMVPFDHNDGLRIRI